MRCAPSGAAGRPSEQGGSFPAMHQPWARSATCHANHPPIKPYHNEPSDCGCISQTMVRSMLQLQHFIKASAVRTYQRPTTVQQGQPQGFEGRLIPTPTCCCGAHHGSPCPLSSPHTPHCQGDCSVPGVCVAAANEGGVLHTEGAHQLPDDRYFSVSQIGPALLFLTLQLQSVPKCSISGWT